MQRPRFTEYERQLSTGRGSKAPAGTGLGTVDAPRIDVYRKTERAAGECPAPAGERCPAKCPGFAAFRDESGCPVAEI